MTRTPKLAIVGGAVSDDAAREVIRRQLDRNVIVEAAAGTGKTTELVNRIVAVLASGRATVDRIVGVTFTEKAAGELKLRVREGLEHERQRVTPGSAEQLNLERALARLEETWVGTIHGFCGEILRERSVEAGVDPNFEVLTESEARRTFDEAFRGWFEAQLAEPSAGTRRSLRRTAREDDDGGPISRLANAGWALAEWRDFTAAWRREPFDREAVIDALVDDLIDYASMTERAARPDRDGHFTASLPARTLSLEIRTAETVRERDYDGIEARLVDLAGTWKFRDAAAGYGETFAPGLPRAEVVARHRQLVQALAEFQRRADADLAARLQQELKGALDRYEALKRRRGRLDFVDLLIRARDLVRDRADVRAAFQLRFTHLFVDEFQDTDPLQAEIILLLAATDAAERDWTHATPTAGKLFLVGDPKQAIYRFRRADVGVYAQVKRQLERAGAVSVELTRSFRSTPSIQNAVNAAFAPLLDGDADAQQADYVPLSPVREEYDAQPSVIALPVPEPYGARNLSKSAIDISLPGAVAAFVEWLLGTSGWTVTEREQPGVRVPIAPRHVCLLFRRFDAMWSGNVTQRYVTELEARGVRHLLVGGRTYHEREEIEALRTALAAIEWPDDELSVFATLHGPLFAILDETLLEYRHTYRHLHPFRPAVDAPSRLAPIVEALALLAELHRHRNARPIAETVHLLLETTRAHAGFAFQPSGEQALANVLHLAEQARAYEQTGGISFRGFVEQLLEDAERKTSSEAPILEEGSEGVRIMTVHKAKGLEFPIVILADITARITRVQPSRFIDPAKNLCALKLAGWSPVELLDRAGVEVDRDYAEGVRVAYVAATRARDLLVVPAVADFVSGSPYDGGQRNADGSWRWPPYWTAPLQRGIFPALAHANKSQPAPGTPAFGLDPTLSRPDPDPVDYVRPGLHDLGHGYGVVWWDPHALELRPPKPRGIRRDDLIAKDTDPKIIEADLRTHLVWKQRREDTIARASAPSLRVATVTERALHEGPAGVDLAAVEVVRVAATADLDMPVGKRFGALVHAVLATVPLDGDAGAVRATATLHARIFAASAPEVAAAVTAVTAILAHPLLDRARHAVVCRREAPIVFVDDDGTVVDGTIDLAFEETDGWTVVDFKTSREMGEDAAVQRRQVTLYVKGLAAATGKSARGIVLVV